MHPRRRIFAGGFFFSLCGALAFYVILPYLSTFLGASQAGLVVTAGGVGATVLFFLLPRLFARYGAQWLTLVFTVLEIVLLAMLGSRPDPSLGVALVVAVVICTPFIAYGLDLLLEATMEDHRAAGRVRALFFTAWNLGILAAPIALGLVLDGTDAYHLVFLAAAAALFPLAVLLSGRRLPLGEAPRLASLHDTLVKIECDRDLLAVTFAHQLLWFMYVWAPLYVPLYLRTALGLEWSTLGWVFFIMLIPYVVLEYPAGWLADNVLGEKELMIAGFLVAGLSFASLVFLTRESSIWTVVGVLVASRVGTALVESTTEGHFFRRISRRDLSSISIFRGAWPVAYVVAPLVASVILAVSSYQMFFVVIGAVVAFAGAAAAAAIKDSR